MKKVIDFIKKRAKIIGGTIASAALLSLAVFPTLSGTAYGPQFNFMECDKEFLRGLNNTQKEDVWKDPVNGKAGDVFDVSVYYHNGRPNTVAENTKVSVEIPTKSANKRVFISAGLWADNANLFSDTVVNGNVNGMTGLTINLDQDATVSYVPGSVKWYPNRSQDASILPFGQSGDEIITRGGINIGDIQGCWPYSGNIVFSVKTNPIVIPKPEDVVISKVVRNVSDNQSAFVETATADQAETVEYQIEVKNVGESVSKEIIITDLLPDGLEYVAGSAKYIKNGIVYAPQNDLFSAGWNLGTFKPNGEDVAIVSFRAKAPYQIYQSGTLVNKATISNGKSDTANVNINAGDVKIVQSKEAHNVTQNKDATTTPAKSNDEIRYTLFTSNNGSLATDYEVKDGIADVLEYADIVSISDGGEVINGPVGGNEEKIVRYPVIKINPGETIQRSFTVKVKDPLPLATYNVYHYDDKMFNKYGNEILIDIYRPAVVLCPDLVVDKVVRNITKAEEPYVEANTAQAGDTLEYKITIENRGEGLADNVKLSDILPANVIYDDSFTAKIFYNGQLHDFVGKASEGATFVEIAPNEKVYLVFRVKSSVDLASKEHLINTAYAEDEGKKVYDSAETVIEDKVVIVSTQTKVVEKKLPQTGAATAVIAGLISLVAGLNLVYYKKKKELDVIKKALQIA